MPSVKRDYIFRRPGAPNYSIRLQTPGEPAFERSLGVPDYLAAKAIALRKYGDKIADHTAKLAERRPRIESTWQRRYEPGLHDGSNGERVAATDRELSFYSADGRLLRTEPNGGPAHLFVAVPRRLGINIPVAIAEAEPERVSMTVRTADDKLFATYLDHGGKRRAGIHGHYRREAEAVWSKFKELRNGKPLASCDRNDGRKLVAHFQAEGLKSATIQKKITWLNAAVAFAIAEGRFHSLNPFSAIAPDGGDSEKRLPLSEADVKLCKVNLRNLSASDQVLFRLLGSTGARLSEAFQIDGEEPHTKGPRFVIVGKKTSQSQRRVPLPADLLPHVPKAIKGKLFAGTPAAASKRLNRFLRDIDITDPNKVVHSLRHRAQDRLRDADCPAEIRWALLGHEDDTVAAGYGEGFSTAKLKAWIDRIGF